MTPHSDTLSQFVKKLTTEPGVYRMLDAQDHILYVGKASNLKKRVGSYFSKQNAGAKTKALVEKIARIEVTVTRSETEALLLESSLIKSLKPKYNVLMRDDKSYPYLHVSSHDFPRMSTYRSKKKPVKGEFYGPFPNVLALRDTLNTIQKIFKIRNCSDSFYAARSRPCLQYQIKRCTAPCVGYISKEEYQKSVQDARHFLQGKSQLILKELEERMKQAVSSLAFEEAAFLRDQIKSLRVVQEQQGVVRLSGDADVLALSAQPGLACVQCVTIREGQVLSSRAHFPSLPEEAWQSTDPLDLWQQVFTAFIGFYYLENPERIPPLIISNHSLEDKLILQEALSLKRGSRCLIQNQPRGDKARWLDFALNNLQLSLAERETSTLTLAKRYQSLLAILGRQTPIKRMECFDISHTMGAETVASCVVFDEHGPQSGQYRRFNITGIQPGDDYAAMEQAISRRFKRLKVLADLPDLLIIDGGKGQVSVALRVLAELGISELEVIGVAKGPERKAGWERLILSAQNRELSLDDHSPALHLLQHIRDEAHRFAITAHRKKRQKAGIESSLLSIEGVGAKRRQALLQRFGGLRELAKASIEEIAKVEGISPALAEKIYNHFR